MGLNLRDVDVLEELYTEENQSEVNLKKLATLLGIKDNELAHALKIDTSALSRKPYAPSNTVLKQWLIIFNLIITIIGQTEPESTPENTKLKMQRWLKLPRPEFEGKSALEYMLNGKARRIKNILEQLLV